MLDRLAAGRFQWDPDTRVATLPVKPERGLQTRIEAFDVFKDIKKLLHQYKGFGQEKTSPPTPTPF